MLRGCCLFIFGMFCVNIYTPPIEIKINVDAMTQDQTIAAGNAYAFAYAFATISLKDLTGDQILKCAELSNRLRKNSAGCGSLEIPDFIDVTKPGLLDFEKNPEALAKCYEFVCAFGFQYYNKIQNNIVDSILNGNSRR